MLYQGITKICRMRHKPKMDRLFEETLGKSWECWQTEVNRKHFIKLGIDRDPQICGCNSDPNAATEEWHHYQKMHGRRSKETIPL